jgi:NIPSNAP
MIYELRVYKCSHGRLSDLLARFEAPVLQIWKELDIRPLGFWSSESVSDGKSVEELVYLLKWNSEDERKEKMGAFLKDPRWLDARDKSEANGKLVESFTSKDLNPVPFSEMK